MTDMKRISISLPTDIEMAILDLRKKDEFCRCSYSEIIRKLIKVGLGYPDELNKNNTLKQ